MKYNSSAVPEPNHLPPGRSRRTGAWLVTFILLALTLPGFEMRAGVLHRETFDTDPGWKVVGEGAPWADIVVTDGQALLRFSRLQPTDPDGLPGWVAGFVPPAPGWPVRFGRDHTIELRVDVIQFSQEDAFAGLEVYGNSPVTGYIVVLERNEIVLSKFGMSPAGWAEAFFLWESVALPIAPLTLSAAFTQVEDDLLIHLQILDRTEQTVLWERKVWDTAGDDPVLPNRSERGLLMKPEPFVAPYTSQAMYPCVAMGYVNTTTAPTQPIEVIIDNVQMLDYEVPTARIEKAVCLSWPADTLEEQIVVGADAIEGPWRPWPAPIYQQSGRWCMAAPITTPQQWFEPQKYFRPVPGTQFFDNFDPPRWPYATKGAWVPGFFELEDPARWSITYPDGVLRVRTLGTRQSQYLSLIPPGPAVSVRDFWMSVDILDLAVTRQDAGIALFARVMGDFSAYPRGATNGYLASLWPNWSGPNQAALTIWDYEKTSAPSAVPDFKPGTAYRLIFSGVGPRLSLELFDLESGQRKAELVVTDNSALASSQGAVGLTLQTGANTSPCDLTLDNFFVTGTKPESP